MFKKFFFVVFVIFSFVIVATSDVSADAAIDRIIRNNEIQKKRCVDVAEHLGKGDDSQLMSDVYQYRFCYPFLDEYSPFSKDLVDEMTRLAFLADTTKDAREAQQNLVDYKKFVKVHLVNIDVAKMAYTLSKQNSQFGNPVLLKKVINFLQSAIYPPGRPKALVPENAYYVINYGEENFVLSQVGGKLVHSEIYEVGLSFYNAHDIEDPKTGKVETYYVDITTPIERLKEREKIREYKNSLGVGKF